MPKYIFTYHQPQDYVPGTDSGALAAWQSFFEGIADHVVDPGQPVFDRRTIGTVGTATQLGGYSVVEANDLDHAMTLATECPTLQNGGGVQVGELTELSDDHIAARLRKQVSAS